MFPHEVAPENGADPNDRGPGFPWEVRAKELAVWTMERLVNRIDVWGAYYSLRQRECGFLRQDGTRHYPSGGYTLRQTGRTGLDLAKLRRHYRAWQPQKVRGVHSTSPENTCKWLGLDIDNHADDDRPMPEANWRAAKAWYDRLTALGACVLLTDSNGKAGYHCVALFDRPAPSELVHAIGRGLVSDYADYGLTAPPEVFPKQAFLPPGGNGHWLRLPGLHHTRKHHSRPWNGQAWLDRHAAIDFIVSLRGAPVERLAHLAAPALPVASVPAPRPATAPREPAEAPRPRQTAYPRRRTKASIARYIAKCSHLSEGQGRDDVAYTLSCHLLLRCGLSDSEALPLIEGWDAGNTPPKGTARLQQIMLNARKYGREHSDYLPTLDMDTTPLPGTPGGGGVSLIGAVFQPTDSVSFLKAKLQIALTHPSPITSGYAQPAYALLASLCRELSRGKDSPEFFVSSADVATVFDIKTRLAREYLTRLCQDGILVRLKQGNSYERKASRYRYVGPPAL